MAYGGIPDSMVIFLRYCMKDDIRVALNIDAKNSKWSNFGDIMEYSQSIDSIVGKSKTISNFHELAEQIRKAIARDGEKSELVFCKQGKEISVENVGVINQFWLNLEVYPEKPEYDINRLDIGVPSLSYKPELSLKRWFRLSFEEHYSDIVYSDGFSQKDENIIEKMHCRMAEIIMSVDNLRNLDYNPEYQFYILLSETIPSPTQKEIYRKLSEDANKTHHKMHLFSESNPGFGVGFNEYDGIPSTVLIGGAVPKPKSYLSLVKVLQDGIKLEDTI